MKTFVSNGFIERKSHSVSERHQGGLSHSELYLTHHIYDKCTNKYVFLSVFLRSIYSECDIWLQFKGPFPLLQQKQKQQKQQLLT